MGLLRQNLNKYTHIYQKNMGFISDTTIREWFGKGTEVRTEIKDMSFPKRSAVVMVGVSGSGKTHFARELVKAFPGFVLFSHDECFAKASIECKGGREADLDIRMNIHLEKMLSNAVRNNQNVVFDGLFVSPVVRAALINTLKAMGFQIHVVYITLETLVEKLPEYAVMRAIQHFTHKEYCKQHKSTLSAQQMVTLRYNAIAKYGEDRGLTEDEVIQSLINHPEIVKSYKLGAENAIREVEQHGVKHQELIGAFRFGADYYYEI